MTRQRITNLETAEKYIADCDEQIAEAFARNGVPYPPTELKYERRALLRYMMGWEPLWLASEDIFIWKHKGTWVEEPMTHEEWNVLESLGLKKPRPGVPTPHPQDRDFVPPIPLKD